MLVIRPDAVLHPNQLPEDHWLFLQKRKKKSSPFGQYILWNIPLRRRTLSQASRKGHRTSSHNGSIRSDPTLSPDIAALLPQGLEPTLILTFNTLECFVQRSNWILEMLLPQLQSRFISAQNVFFATWIIKLFLSVFGCFDGPQSFCLLGLLRFLYTHSPAHYLVGVIHFFPIFSFNAFVQRLTEGLPITISQGRAPPFRFNVVDIGQRLRGLHFFSHQCQLIRALPDDHIRALFRSFRLPNFKCSRAPA